MLHYLRAVYAEKTTPYVNKTGDLSGSLAGAPKGGLCLFGILFSYFDLLWYLEALSFPGCFLLWLQELQALRPGPPDWGAAGVIGPPRAFVAGMTRVS